MLCVICKTKPVVGGAVFCFKTHVCRWCKGLATKAGW